MQQVMQPAQQRAMQLVRRRAQPPAMQRAQLPAMRRVQPPAMKLGLPLEPRQVLARVQRWARRSVGQSEPEVAMESGLQLVIHQTRGKFECRCRSIRCSIDKDWVGW